MQQQLATSLGNLALEERGRATSIPAIMMGRNPKDSPIVDAMVQNWKYSVEQLSLLLNQCTAGGSIVSKEDAGKIELQIANILRFTINNMSPTGGTSFMAFLIRCLDEAQALDVNFVMDKYKRINKVTDASNLRSRC